jgi:adenosylmethionine-8-amino-7-oxononanoate aminotransferase
MDNIAAATGALVNVRSLGYAAAADIVNPATGAPYPAGQRTGYKCYRKAVELGALLRPLGDTVYFFPPLNIQDNVLDRLADIAERAILSVVNPSWG